VGIGAVSGRNRHTGQVMRPISHALRRALRNAPRSVRAFTRTEQRWHHSPLTGITP
jgi:hypothetical protein